MTVEHEHENYFAEVEEINDEQNREEDEKHELIHVAND